MRVRIRIHSVRSTSSRNGCQSVLVVFSPLLSIHTHIHTHYIIREKGDVRFLVTSASNSSNNSTSASKQPCLVCHEDSSGYHFGAYTCESCKAFYRRVTKGN